MPKQQSSLDSFFGTQGTQKKQKTLTTFFKKDKENKKIEEEEGKDVKEEEEEATVRKPQKNAANKRRRHAIVDDEDSDDDDVAPMEVDDEKEEVKEPSKTPSTTKQEDESSSISVVSPPAKNDDAKEAKNDDKIKKEPSKPTPANFFKAKSTDTKKGATSKTVKKEQKSEDTKTEATAKKPTKTTTDDDDDDKLTPLSPKQEDTSDNDCPHRKQFAVDSEKMAKAAKVDWEVDELSSPIAYKDLVDTLNQIDAITGRLEIQSILTKLFRRVLKSSPLDLYHVVYLASNSIAPAYECVELGIGDSILIRAIGEAYGTKPGKWRRSQVVLAFECFLRLDTTTFLTTAYFCFVCFYQHLSSKSTKKLETWERWPCRASPISERCRLV
jgi:DNA ligase-1